MRSSTIVTILTVTRARRQVVGPTPKPRCRRQCGNAARAAALGLCSPPPSVKDGTGQGGRGSPAPDRTSARSGLRVGAADRPPPHSARRCLCRENDGRVREGVFSHPRSTFLPQPRKCVEGTRSHTCAPDEGTPPRRGAGPAEWICTGKQPPHTRARRPTLGPPGLQLGSPTRARTQERPLGARRWRSPLLTSGQYVADTCARGGGGPLGLTWP